MPKKLDLCGIYIDGYTNKTSYIYQDSRGKLFTKTKKNKPKRFIPYKQPSLTLSKSSGIN